MAQLAAQQGGVDRRAQASCICYKIYKSISSSIAQWRSPTPFSHVLSLASTPTVVKVYRRQCWTLKKQPSTPHGPQDQQSRKAGPASFSLTQSFAGRAVNDPRVPKNIQSRPYALDAVPLFRRPRELRAVSAHQRGVLSFTAQGATCASVHKAIAKTFLHATMFPRPYQPPAGSRAVLRHCIQGTRVRGLLGGAESLGHCVGRCKGK